MAQLVEHILGKDEVPSSNLGSSSKKRNTLAIAGVFLFSAPPPIDSHRVFALCAKSSSVTPPEVGVLAHQAQGAGIFATGEYLGSRTQKGAFFV